MTLHNAVNTRLMRLFACKPVVDLPVLKNALGTSSHMTVFRALSRMGYRTSYSHGGRYYTPASIPRFDQDGLWTHGDVLFSKDGTLRATIVSLVTNAIAGKTHAELQDKLRLRVYDTLLDLVTDKQIGRAELEGLYLYVSADASRARAQLQARHCMPPALPQPPASLSEPEVTIEILLVVIRHPKEDIEGIVSALRLSKQGISREQVEAVWARYGLGKKKAGWKHSPR